MSNRQAEATLTRKEEGISPLAKVVLRALRREIARREIPPGAPLPSERALAERHSVSRTIVREALGVLAHEGVLIQSGRCRPVVAPTPVRRHRVGVRRLGIWLWPHAEDALAAAIVRGIQRAARRSDARLLIGTASHTSWDDDVEAEARFIRSLAEEEAEGAILWYIGGDRNRSALREAREQGVEFVFVDRLPPQGFEADFVGTENIGTARNVVNHLIELGHRRIAFAGNLDTASTVMERRRGWQRAIEEAGLKSNLEAAFAPRELEPEALAARRTAQNVLDQGATAVFAVNDMVALLLIEAFRELGKAVPDDVSIVGFDGLFSWLPGGGPSRRLGKTLLPSANTRPRRFSRASSPTRLRHTATSSWTRH